MALRAISYVLVAMALAVPSAASARNVSRTISVDCDATGRAKLLLRLQDRDTIGRALVRARDGDTIEVRGTCTEQVTVDSEVSLEGVDGARIVSPDPLGVPLRIRSRNVRVEGLTLDAPARVQILVENQATVTLDGNAIGNAERGIVISGGSLARLTSNTIEDAPSAGILVLENSVARIGFVELGDTVAAPNQVLGSGIGLLVLGNATADVRGNTFEANATGIVVTTGGRAVIAGNTLRNLMLDIFLSTNATVFLTEPGNPNPLLSAPNVSAGAGILCSGGSIAGSLGLQLGGVRAGSPPGSLRGVPLPAPGTFTFCEDATTP